MHVSPIVKGVRGVHSLPVSLGRGYHQFGTDSIGIWGGAALVLGAGPWALGQIEEAWCWKFGVGSLGCSHRKLETIRK